MLPLAANEKLWLALLDIEHFADKSVLDDNSPPDPADLQAAYTKVESAEQALTQSRGHIAVVAEDAVRQWLLWWNGWLEHVTISVGVYYEIEHGDPGIWIPLLRPCLIGSEGASPLAGSSARHREKARKNERQGPVGIDSELREWIVGVDLRQHHQRRTWSAVCSVLPSISDS